MAHNNWTIPPHIISSGDVKRLKRELEQLEEFIKQSNLRKPGTFLEKLPKTSRSLSDFGELNKLNLLLEKDRLLANQFLADLIDKAPVVNVGLATEPSVVFMTKIAAWFRNNINPLILINFGLEPTIAAGCTIRTLNKFHDFSLRKHFDAQHPLLLSKIKESSTQV